MKQATGAMSERRWTTAQEEAIRLRGGNLLVAAAAGTGKTTVLVERVKNWVTEPPRWDIDRLLVVTFTQAAASEVRQRLAGALAQALESRPGNLWLRRQLALLNQAQISTLHSFCLDLLRRYFYLLGLDPGFRVAEEEETLLLRLEVMEEIFEQAYEREYAVFLRLVDCYGGGRGDGPLQDLILRLYQFSRSHRDPEGWLEAAAAGFSTAAAGGVEGLPWMAAVAQAVRLELEGAGGCLREARDLVEGMSPLAPYREVISGDLDQVKTLLRSLTEDSWENWRLRLQLLSFGRLPALRLKEADPRVQQARDSARKVRDEAKAILKRLKQEYGGQSAAELRESLIQVAPLMDGLVDLTRRFGGRYQAAKRARGILDYADLEHYALRLIYPDRPGEVSLAGELSRHFVEVLVDEYQDINEVQEAILLGISRENLFLVGDLKQSIYRFRLAEPRLFQEKYDQYRRGRGGRCLHLSVNFRGRRPVLAAVNFIFRQLMNPQVLEMSYPEEAELKYGADYPEAGGISTAEGPVEFHILESRPEEDSEESSVQREAALVAARIQAMVKGTPEKPGPEFSVLEGEGYVPVGFRHVAVLLRATSGRAALFLEALGKQGIQATTDLSSGFFDAAEVRLLTALLQVVDNPRQDIPLAAVLRSPIFGLSAADLARIRLGQRRGEFYDAVVKARQDPSAGSLREQAGGFLDRLAGWQTMAARLPLPEFIWKLLMDTGYYQFLGGRPGGNRSQTNLRALVDRARRFETTGHYGLFSFLRHLHDLEKSGVDPGPVQSSGNPEEAVRIMSVHKAKGLEFPVVVVADLGRRFNQDELTGDLLLHRDLGLGPMMVRPDQRYKYPTLAYRAIRDRARLQNLAEEIRLLYVALTRARERLILVGSARGLKGRAATWVRAARGSGWPLEPHWLTEANSFLDLLGPAVARHTHGKPLRKLGDCDEPPGDAEVAADASSWQVWCGPSSVSGERGTPEISQGRGRLAEGGVTLAAFGEVGATYDYGSLPRLAGKVTVSKLSRLEAYDYDQELPARLLGQNAIGRKPGFITGETRPQGVLLGVATHLVLQHLDLNRPLDDQDISEQVAAMTLKGILSEEQAGVIEVDSLSSFWRSSLGRRLREGAAKVRREVRFSAGLPAGIIYPDMVNREESRELVLVQGAIDLLLEEDDGFLLLDFKTDRSGAGDRGVLLAYQRQLFYYAQAVQTIFRRPVKEAWLSFLSTGEIVLLNLNYQEEGKIGRGPAGEDS